MSREAIMARVREALQNKTDSHVRHKVDEKPALNALPVLANGPDGTLQAVREFLPRVGPSFEDHKEAFQILSDKLQTEFICVSNMDAAKHQVSELKTKYNWNKAGVHETQLVNEVTTDLGLETLSTTAAYETRALESCDVGISGCDALIAQTASVLVSVKSAGGRALSVLPPHHLVIATRDQMVTTMADGLEILREAYGEKWPSFMSFITGPSRTADIERVLVLGAHGPKKLTVILIEE